MGKKLTDSEKEVRRKERNKKLSYKTYSEGPRGSASQWKLVAELILAERGSSTNLSLLGIDAIPSSLDDLNKAWRKAMIKAHPDRGGVNEQAVNINQAYEKLKLHFANRLLVEQDSDVIEPAKAEHIPHGDYADLWDDSAFINDTYIAEKKLDGSRYILYLGETCRLLSRRISTITGKYVDKTLNCPHLTRVPIPKELWGTTLDGEVIHPKEEKSDATTSIMGCTPEESVERQKEQGWLKYSVYDLPRYKGKDIRHRPLHYRKAKLTTLIAELKKYIPVQILDHSPSSEAKSLYNDIVAKKGEGIMLKDLNAPYGEGWFKVKKVVTFDVVIIGYQRPKKSSKKSDGTISSTHLHRDGYIGSIIFGAYREGVLVELGTCSGMAVSVRKELSLNGEKNIGKVIEIKFQERTKSGAFRHARFIRFRKDKSAIQCLDEVTS